MKIVTHNQKAHLDDFLATAVTYAYYSANSLEEIEVFRKAAPSEEDINDPSTFVLDFGMCCEPNLRNFDHHFIKGGEVCAFTQVLEYLGMRDCDALPWIKFVEVWDHCGPTNAMNLLGGGDSNLIFSPVQAVLISEFSDFEGQLSAADIKSVKLLEIGNFIIDKFKTFSETTAELGKATIKTVNGYNVADYRPIDANFPLNFEAAGKFEKKNGIDLIVSHNPRGKFEWRMIRKNETGVDFNPLRGLPGVDFVHQSGFLACFDGDFEVLLAQLPTKHDSNIN